MNLLEFGVLSKVLCIRDFSHLPRVQAGAHMKQPSHKFHYVSNLLTFFSGRAHVGFGWLQLGLGNLLVRFALG